MGEEGHRGESGRLLSTVLGASRSDDGSELLGQRL